MNEYWQNGLLHRDSGPAIITRRLGLLYEEHWVRGRLHCEHAPAVRHDCVREEWWVQNQRHREDGPAIDARGRIRLPLMDREFNVIPRLTEQPQAWEAFAQSGENHIGQYLDGIFGGQHPFASYGDFGAQPVVMVEALGLNRLDLHQLRFRVSYDPSPWQKRFWPGNPGEYHDNSIFNKMTTKDKAGEFDTNDDGPGIFDLLGSYDMPGRGITLYIRAITGCAERLDQIRNNPCGPSAMTLTTMVFLHELGHALHHASRGGRPDDDLGGSIPAETVAQHFMMSCIHAHGVRAEWLADRLEQHQPAAYRAWRTCGFPTTWEGCRQLVKQNP